MTTTTLKVETFSYLPPLSREEIRQEIQYILDQGWIPGVEYTPRIDPAESYWHWWKLPLFNARTPEEVLAEIDACHEAHPDCFIRITAYDNHQSRQMQAFVAYRPETH